MSINKPNIEELKQKTSSIYSLVVDVAKRARQIVDGARPLVDETGKKPIAIAVEEIRQGLVTEKQKELQSEDA